MPWIEKDQPTPFDSQPMEGLFFLIGDILARKHGEAWVEGKKYPMVAFQSGLKRELQHDTRTKPPEYVHVYSDMRLPLHSDGHDAYLEALALAILYGYNVMQFSETVFEIWRPRLGGRYRAIYDNTQNRLDNLGYVPGEPRSRRPPRPMELIDDELRAVLPPLYSNEKLGLDAMAPVKLFTPDSNWTWYASEFDGEELFFGLVSGFDVELGYFTLTELESVRGSLGLTIERDLHYKPQTLQQLLDFHRSQRQ